MSNPTLREAAMAALPESLRFKLAGIAAECSDPDTTDALDKLLAEAPAAPTSGEAPSTAEQVRDFIGSQFGALKYGREDHKPCDEDCYTLTAHDLISAFWEWSTFDRPAPGATHTDEATPPSAAQGEGGIPAGWVPLRLEWEPGYPEDVAFGPPRMMERLKKWLDKHFAAKVAATDVVEALDYVDDFIARCTGDDRGACNAVNVLRRALTAAPEKLEGQRERETLLRVIQTLNQNPYSLTKSECIEVVREMMDAAHAPHQQAKQPTPEESSVVPQQAAQGGERAKEGGHSYEASMLRNLLARIHGDGGHYVAEHGLDAALDAAESWVASARAAQGGREGLTDEQIAEAMTGIPVGIPFGALCRIARAIERACAEAWGVKLTTPEGGA